MSSKGIQRHIRGFAAETVFYTPKKERKQKQKQKPAIALTCYSYSKNLLRNWQRKPKSLLFFEVVFPSELLVYTKLCYLLETL